MGTANSKTKEKTKERRKTDSPKKIGKQETKPLSPEARTMADFYGVEFIKIPSK
ncbi:MAG: hypothetical protein IID18_09080 [Nitrospinae bacterium]|nr:hypothetical protein [Nitrospinota bacterium]